MTTNEPLVSIIIPMYNSERYIINCLNSVISQNYQNIEVLVVDDGSNDNSYTLCQKASEESNCLKVLHKENGGVSSARNFGLDNCSGELITFVDADDYIEPYHIASLVEALKDDIDCSICGYCLDYSGIYNVYACTQTLYLDVRQAMYNMLIPTMYQGFVCNKMFRRSIIEANQVRLREDIFYCEDLLFCAEYFRFCHRVCCIMPATYHYRQHIESTVNRQNVSPKQLERMLTGITVLHSCADLYNNYPEISALALARAGTEYARIFRRAYSSGASKITANMLLRDMRSYKNNVLNSTLSIKEKIKFLSTCIMPGAASKLWTARETRFL